MRCLGLCRRVLCHGSMLLPLTVLMVLVAPMVSGTMHPAVQACSSLTVQSDRDTYTTGDPVAITVSFHALLPGCMQPMFVHGYVLTIQIFNATNGEVYSWNHTIPGSVTINESWTATTAGAYSINATTWLTIPGNDLMTKGLEANKVIQVQDPQQLTAIELTLGALATLAVAGGYLILRRSRKNSKVDGTTNPINRAKRGMWCLDDSTRTSLLRSKHSQ